MNKEGFIYFFIHVYRNHAIKSTDSRRVLHCQMLSASCRLKPTMLKVLLVALVFKLQNVASRPADPAAVSDAGPSYHYNMEHLQNQININQNNVVNIDGILESAQESVKSTENDTTAVKSMVNGNTDHIIDKLEKEPKNENKEGHPDMKDAIPNADEKTEDKQIVKPVVEQKPEVIADKTEKLEKVVEIEKVDEGKEPEKEHIDELKEFKEDVPKPNEEKVDEKIEEDKGGVKRENTQGKKKRAI